MIAHIRCHGYPVRLVQDENCSIFFSSHITSDIEKIADFVTVIDNGKVILCDEKDSILDKLYYELYDCWDDIDYNFYNNEYH